MGAIYPPVVGGRLSSDNLLFVRRKYNWLSAGADKNLSLRFRFCHAGCSPLRVDFPNQKKRKNPLTKI